ncbi:hypothetical protein JCM8202_005077 [Rhodotorula sphaerocarpa]
MESFRQKLAHNSRVSLGPRDIKLLQECITTERKLVDQSTRLANERDKASHALREWAGAEGPDLNDVVSKVCSLYEYLSKAEQAYAEHNGNYRIRFKEIRSKEESLAALKKSRDSLGGRIEAQDRKVSKMKEENKDLPAQRQRLRDMQQEMIGLEHSVVTEETRLGDFKRAATRAALSLKLGAMLELAEKTVIIAELGKLMVDMLPTEETEPGQPRAYYDGYTRTDELLSEAQRCLQDVVFNPAPITEGFAQHGGTTTLGRSTATEADHTAVYGVAEGYRPHTGHGEHAVYGEGSPHPQDQFNEAGIRPVDPNNDYSAHHQYQQESAHGGYAHPRGEHEPQTTHRYSTGPQLQPLPDFRPISSFQPQLAPEEEERNHWTEGPEHASRTYRTEEVTPAARTATPVHDAFATSSAREANAATSLALAPPIPDARSAADRSSLAYMGSEPDMEAHEQEQVVTVPSHPATTADEVEAREAAQALDDAMRQHQDEAGTYDSMNSPSVYTRHTNSVPPTPTDAQSVPHARPEEAAPAEHPSLPPIVEVATPSMHQVASRDEQVLALSEQEQGEFRSLDHAEPAATTAQTESEIVEEHRQPYSPALAASEASAPAYVAQSVETRQYEPALSHERVRQTSAERTRQAASPLPSRSSHVPDVPTSPGLAAGNFEPRPLSARYNSNSDAASASTATRRPIQIRPMGDGALGSKYGDLTDSGRESTGASYGEAGLPPYLRSQSPGSASATGEQKRTLPASAFRRPQSAAMGPASPGLRSFSPSGYQYDSAAAEQAAAQHSSSESAAIAQRWRDSSIPLVPGENGGESHPTSEDEFATPATTPGFDVRPLQVHRPAGGARSPHSFGAAHMRSSSYSDNYVSAAETEEPPAAAGHGPPPVVGQPASSHGQH